MLLRNSSDMVKIFGTGESFCALALICELVAAVDVIASATASVRSQ